MSLLASLLSISIVLSVIMLSLMFFFRKAPYLLSAKSRYTLWIIILIGLLIPFRPSLVTPLLMVHQEEVTYPTEAQVLSDTEAVGEAQGDIIESATNAVFSNNVIKEFFLPSIGILVLIVWGLGASIILLRNIVQYRRFYNLLRRWSKPISDDKTIKLFESAKVKLGLSKQEIGLFRNKSVDTPMLVGLLKPMVILPEKAMSDLDLTLTFEHELTHYKHKDLFVNLLGLLVLSIHWFNPILYFCIPLVQEDGELYCDESVLENKNENERSLYGKMIIDMIPIASSKHMLLSTCFYSKKLSVKKRILNIMKKTKSKKKLAVLFTSGVLAVTMLSGSLVAFAAPSNIGVEKAKAIALRDAKVSNVTFVKAKLDRDNGVLIYDVEFYKGNVEYDYEIEATTGRILERDRDIENYVIPKNPPKKQVTTNKQNTVNQYKGDIGVEKAKTIALRDANVGQVNFIKAKLDYDDGIYKYDIEFYAGNMEYDYEIEASTGRILEKDIDIRD